MRPSTTVARFTPPSTARRQAAIFGTIPASSAGQDLGQLAGVDLLDQRVAVGPVGVEPLDVGEDDELHRAQRDGQRRGGGVGVEVVQLRRSRRGRRSETTGMWPASSSAVTGVGSTETTSPTKPMSTGSPSTIAVRAGGGEQAAVLTGEARRRGRRAR